MPQETKAIFHQTEHTARQGLQATTADPAALRKAVELAVDYRGDVTIERRESAESVECFIFDIKLKGEAIAAVRAIPKDSDEKLVIPFEEIQSLTFSGRDTAAGRSFDTWMKNYVKKKMSGEEASIESESLD